MEKKCVICTEKFTTLSDTRKTCSVDCAEKFRKHKQASYEFIPKFCNFNMLESKYHGGITT